MGGSWAKWFLILSSLEADKQFVVLVLLLSSLLNIAYLLPLVAKGFYLNPLDQQKSKVLKNLAHLFGYRLQLQLASHSFCFFM
jgi:NADH:ubiquinone oxidoreductase subunit 2 (subunit N)